MEDDTSPQSGTISELPGSNPAIDAARRIVEAEDAYNNQTKERPYAAGTMSGLVMDHGLDIARAYLAAVETQGWQPIETAPRDRFIFLWCPEDESRWLAKWQGGEWYGVDDEGLTRSNGYHVGSGRVTGWEIIAWQPLPAPPTNTPHR